MKLRNDWKNKIQEFLDAYERECEHIYSKIEKECDGRVIAALAVSVAAIYREKLLAILRSKTLFSGQESIRNALRDSLELSSEDTNCGGSHMEAMMAFTKISKTFIRLDSAGLLFPSASRSAQP